MRLRVHSEMDSLGRCWMFDVYEPGRPAGVRISGVRPSWAEAMQAGCSLVRQFTPRSRLASVESPGNDGFRYERKIRSA